MQQIKTLLVTGMILAAMVSSASAAIIIDNEDATGYSCLGSAGTWAGASGEYNANYEYGSAAAFEATYSFIGLANGTYEVYATWAANDLHYSAAQYSITPAGSTTTVATVNMELPPAVDLQLTDSELETVNFQRLATIDVTNGTVGVVLDGGSSTLTTKYLVGDAVALVAVPEPATLGLLGIGGLVGLLKKRR